MIEIHGFPMPPSDNKLKTPALIRGKPRSRESSEYSAYKFAALIWSKKNHEAIEKAREFTLQCQPGWAIKIDRVFWFKADSVICISDGKKGSTTRAGDPKRNDTFNRIKALHDVFSALLGLDDKWFWAGNTEKKILSHPAFPECVDITLSLVDMHSK